MIGDAEATAAERARQRAERGDALAFDFGPPVEEALANCEAETGLPAPAKAKPLRWSPLESRESALERARVGEHFGGAAGFGERPAVVVVDLNVGFTDPSSPLACDLDEVLVATRRVLDAARAAGVPVFFTTIDYDEVGEAAAAVFLRKAPALKVLRPGTRWVEIDPRLGRRCDEPVLVKAHASAFFGVPFAALLAGRDTLDRVRRVDLGLRARDGRGRDAARALADHPARVRGRPLAARPRAGARRHGRALRRRRQRGGGAVRA